MRTLYVYILANRHRTVFYTGVTNNLQRRLAEHRSGSRFASFYRTHTLVYVEAVVGPMTAIRPEKQIKRWGRAKKLALIWSVNPDLRDLEAEWLCVDAEGEACARSIASGIPRLRRGDADDRGTRVVGERKTDMGTPPIRGRRATDHDANAYVARASKSAAADPHFQVGSSPSSPAKRGSRSTSRSLGDGLLLSLTCVPSQS